MILELSPVIASPAPPHPDALVCVVDDDESIRRSLERLFRSARFPVETFASAADYLKRKPHPGPVCLVLDMRMPGLDGFDLQKALAGRCEQIVFLTGNGDVLTCVKAMKAGAADFLTKPVNDDDLLDAVTGAIHRALEVGISNAEQSKARTILASLTNRESEVMRCVVSGMLNKQIAAKLGIAEKTVKIHRGRMMRKTGCVSVPEVIRLLQHAGHLNEPSHLQPPS